jgi:hypothetical protein
MSSSLILETVVAFLKLLSVWIVGLEDVRDVPKIWGATDT